MRPLTYDSADDQSAQDLRDIHARGLPYDEVQRQLALLAAPPRHATVVRPCTLGDGVCMLSPEQIADCQIAFEEAQQAGRVLKFIFAAEAASPKNRTALEEHLLEAVAYARDRRGLSRLHFVVPAQHVATFEGYLEEIRPWYEADFATTFDVGFSAPHPSTDTVAVDADNQPLRDAAGRLVFWPGGHGALIENLHDLHADLVFIKDIDNVVPHDLKSATLAWKRIMGGHLVRTQRRIFHYLSVLTQPSTSGLAAIFHEVEGLLRSELGITEPSSVARSSGGAMRAFLISRLDRPLRVCGVVRNVGELGSAPFWTVASDGTLSPQIVESAEIDASSAEQRAIFDAATHFNPVDMVCAVRNRHGVPFDLHRFVDRDAVFIAQKSSDGRSLKALEHPGLWNGAMAGWNTIFVEVPPDTFRSAKAIIDLVRPEHQPAA